MNVLIKKRPDAKTKQLLLEKAAGIAAEIQMCEVQARSGWSRGTGKAGSANTKLK